MLKHLSPHQGKELQELWAGDLVYEAHSAASISAEANYGNANQWKLWAKSSLDTWPTQS